MNDPLQKIEIELHGDPRAIRLLATMISTKQYAVIGLSADQPQLEIDWNVDNLWGLKLGPMFTVIGHATMDDWKEQEAIAVREGLLKAPIEWPELSRFYKVIPEALADAKMIPSSPPLVRGGHRHRATLPETHISTRLESVETTEPKKDD